MNAVGEDKEEDRIFADDSSVESAEDAQELFLSTEQSIEDRLCHTDDVDFTDENGIRGLDPDAPAAEFNFNLPKPPENWKAPAPKIERGEKEFESIDNPGNWGRYAFVPKFDKNKRYLHHELPSKVRPVPVNTAKDGRREISGWEFHSHMAKQKARTASSTTTMRLCLDFIIQLPP
jgi:hypothetical protein